jgi:acyl carrier protein
MINSHLIRLQRIFREALDNPSLQITEDFSTKEYPEWDSVAMVQIIFAVEEEFGVQLGLERMGRIKSVGDILAIIRY